MARFIHEKKRNTARGLILSACAFLCICAFFFYGVGSMASSTEARQKEILEEAVTGKATYCYSVEGSYPKTCQYIEENYGLTYDKDKFYVGYRFMGDNIFPDITVITLE